MNGILKKVCMECFRQNGIHLSIVHNATAHVNIRVPPHSHQHTGIGINGTCVESLFALAPCNLSKILACIFPANATCIKPKLVGDSFLTILNRNTVNQYV